MVVFMERKDIKGFIYLFFVLNSHLCLNLDSSKKLKKVLEPEEEEKSALSHEKNIQTAHRNDSEI